MATQRQVEMQALHQRHSAATDSAGCSSASNSGLASLPGPSGCWGRRPSEARRPSPRPFQAPAMKQPKSDAIVLFGASGDLAYKKIFPALYAMARRGHLEVPVIGVANSPWTTAELVARAKESVEHH